MSAKLRRYECGTTISWDASNKIFKEQDGTSHTRERCAALKEKAGKTPLPDAGKVDGMTDLTAAIRELAAAIRSRPL